MPFSMIKWLDCRSARLFGKCDKLGIDYPKIMTDFIDRLNEDGWNVLIIANGARIHSDKPRNNDLPVCDAVYESVKNKEMVRWYLTKK